MKGNAVRVLNLLVVLSVLVNSALAQTRPRQVEPRGQQDEDVLRIDTTLVTVPVGVRDRNGKFITDLQQNDFRIYEDGIEQKVAYFATVDKPFTVILVLDTSASTWSKLDQIREAAKAFVQQLPSEDQVMVTSFGMGLKVQCEVTGDRQKIRKAIDKTGRGLSTHLYDAMENVMQDRKPSAAQTRTVATNGAVSRRLKVR